MRNKLESSTDSSTSTTPYSSPTSSRSRSPSPILLHSPIYVRRAFIVVACLSFVILVVLYRLCQYSDPYYDSVWEILALQDESGGGCHIPQLDPWDPTILKYVERYDNVKCKQLQPELTYLTDDQWLVFNTTAATNAGYSMSDLTCFYRCFDRPDHPIDDVTIVYSDWVEWTERVRVDRCEFIEDSCERQLLNVRRNVYKNLHNQIVVPQKYRVEPRAGGRSLATARRPSILLFVLDSVSQSSFIRALPKTLQILTDRFNGTFFKGYIKVADNSLPNATPFLMGMATQTAGVTSEIPDDMINSFWNDYPIIWKNFANQGYATYYGEDYPKYALLYYLSKGFKEKPVDHYMRPFWVKLWDSWLHRRATHLCYGNRPKHHLLLNYLRQLLVKYDNSTNTPIFALHWMNELAHDYMNQLAIGDDDLADFFGSLAPILENMVFVVNSDHGHRFDSIRGSVVGRLEERMPAFFIHIPQWIRECFPELARNLVANANKLTSHFDLYATLRDIEQLDFGNCSTEAAGKLPPEVNLKKGKSLFREIAQNRTCAQASIPNEFCVCSRETMVNTTEVTVLKSAQSMVESINDRLESSFPGKCAQLYLKKVEAATVSIPNARVLLDQNSFFKKKASGVNILFRVNIETAPNGAKFEGSVQFDIENNKFNVMGDINRINRYANQSWCIESYQMRKYCYCKMV